MAKRKRELNTVKRRGRQKGELMGTEVAEYSGELAVVTG
jgi:hypothetical protein